jgi:hypothetical protein
MFSEPVIPRPNDVLIELCALFVSDTLTTASASCRFLQRRHDPGVVLAPVDNLSDRFGMKPSGRDCFMRTGGAVAPQPLTPLLWAFVGLLAAGLAGTICAFAANGYWEFQTRVVATLNEAL